MSVISARSFHYRDLRAQGYDHKESREIVDQYVKFEAIIKNGLSDKEAIDKIIN